MEEMSSSDESMSHLLYKRSFFLGLVCICVWLITRIFLLFYLLHSDIGLMPDEAQYWTWSRNLALGYYSKPPGIAWQIALSTALFPSLSAISVRFISFTILPALSAYLLFKIIFRFTRGKKAAYASCIAYLVSPLGFFGSIFATTDGMLLTSVFGAIYSYLRTCDTDKPPLQEVIWIPIWISIGALWKWTSFLLIPLVLLDKRFFFCSNNGARYLQVGRIVLLVFILLLGGAPSCIWNYTHDWVTFRHVEANLLKYEGGQSNSNPVEFFFSSTILMSWGFLLIGLIFGRKYMYYESNQLKKAFLKRLWIGIHILWGSLFIASFFCRVQGNWALLANGCLFVFIGVGLYNLMYTSSLSYRKKMILIVSSIFFSCITQLIAFCTHMFPYESAVRISPLKQGIGLRHGIENALLRMGYRYSDIESKKIFLFSDRYQNIAQLEFYAPCNPVEIYFFNIHGIRLNHYSFRSFDKDVYTGTDGLFIAIIPFRECNMLDMRVERFKSQLSPFFDKVSFVGVEKLRTNSEFPVRALLLFYCKKYNGAQLPVATLPSY